MKLASFLTDAGPSWGLVDGDWVFDLGIPSGIADFKFAIAQQALEKIAAWSKNAPRISIADISLASGHPGPWQDPVRGSQL